MNKKEVIDLSKMYLESKGFTSLDYIVSLQGPTFIFTAEGNKKLSSENRKQLREIGIKVL